MIYLIVIGFVIFLTLGYFFLMFVFPEWVGISGEDTKKALESHRGDPAVKPMSANKTSDSSEESELNQPGDSN